MRRPISGVVFCIACGQCIDGDAPLCACDSERLHAMLVQRIRETAPPTSLPSTRAPRADGAVLGRRFDHVARLAARIAADRSGNGTAPTARDMVLAVNDARASEQSSSGRGDGAA